jgi:hypothetical protein
MRSKLIHSSSPDPIILTSLAELQLRPGIVARLLNNMLELRFHPDDDRLISGGIRPKSFVWEGAMEVSARTESPFSFLPNKMGLKQKAHLS